MLIIPIHSQRMHDEKKTKKKTKTHGNFCVEHGISFTLKCKMNKTLIQFFESIACSAGRDVMIFEHVEHLVPDLILCRGNNCYSIDF